MAGRLVEVTTRTLQERFLLLPGTQANAIIKGVFGRGQARYGMAVCAVVGMSNHLHALLIPTSSRQLSNFMRYVNSNIARKLGRLYGWRDKFWSRRYQAIVVSHEEEAQVQRLVYVLSHGVKEGLVRAAADWPGVQCVAELCAGHEVVSGGVWHDQSAEFEARRRVRPDEKSDFTERYDIVLSPLPCWQHVPRLERAETIRGLVAEIEAKSRADHRARGASPLGVRAVLRQDSHGSPMESKRSPAPWFHAASREARAAMMESYRLFVAAFRAAADALRLGNRLVEFPEGSFPPGLPWVPEARPGPF